MNTITVPIGKGRAQLCELIEKVKAGASVILTNHGQPEVIITRYQPGGNRWRVETPDDPKRYGDLQSPVLDEMP
ncbi:MAG TPA: type II toxin-antitoxin system prevent-host-death family antitoxin [Candidatus Paceibacterota bacterium]|nr:type II toxin-antitoxin system prevent-host-death family antitoxin [Candidatus Paceibacterota bacterium]